MGSSSVARSPVVSVSVNHASEKVLDLKTLARQTNPKLGDIVQVRLYPSGEIVDAEIKAIFQATTSRKYHVSFDVRTALITADQIVEED